LTFIKNTDILVYRYDVSLIDTNINCHNSLMETNVNLSCFPVLSRLLGRSVAMLALAAWLGLLPWVAHAQAYPAKPVKMILSFPAGGITDATFRRIAERFQAITGQPMMLENRPGRGVAANAVAMAEPDGYTLGIVGRSHLSLHHQLRSGLPYPPVEGFTWISGITNSWFGLYVSSASPYKSVQDIIAAAKPKPGDLKYGTAFGHGGLAHVPMEEFSRSAGIQMLHVPFKGDNESVIQLIRGEIDMMVAGGSAMPFVQDGKLRLVAWLSSTRHPRLTQIPTLREQGYPFEINAIVGVGGPRGMSPAHVAILEQTFKQILEEKETLAFLDRNYQKPDYIASAPFTDWARKQLPLEKVIVDRFNLAEQTAPAK
jgi:tripartite-type tricarboxylate transporter receptor subunit TctC